MAYIGAGVQRFNTADELTVTGTSELKNNVTVTGDVTASGTVLPTGDTAAGDAAALGFTSTEGLILTGQGSTSDITLKNDADATVFSVPTGTDDILFPDNAKAMFGAGSDLELYHDGSHSYIQENNSGGNLYIQASNLRLGNTAGSELYMQANENAEVKLYYDASEKLATTSTGVDVTGAVGGDTLNINGTGSGDIAIINTSANSGTGLYVNSQTANQIDLVGYDGSAANAVNIRSGGATGAGLNINTSNNVGIGTSSPNNDLHIQTASGNPELRVESTGANYVTMSVKNSSRHYSTQIRTDQSNAYVVRDETAGANRFLIDTSGKVGIGVSPVSQLTLGGTSDLVFTQNGYGITWGSDNGSPRIFGTSGGALSFKHGGGSTAATINANGNVLVNTTSGLGSAKLVVSSDTSSANPMTVSNTKTSASTDYSILFYRAGNIVGSVQTSLSATSFVQSSDHRLKQNVADMTGAIDRVKALAPKRFNFIADTDTTVDGFLAHEAQTVVPEAVTGTHNEVETWTQKEIDDGDAPDGTSAGDNKLDGDGNTIPVMQGIDQSKLVPLLTGALQEAIAKIETLEAKVAALESA